MCFHKNNGPFYQKHTFAGSVCYWKQGGVSSPLSRWPTRVVLKLLLVGNLFLLMWSFPQGCLSLLMTWWLADPGVEWSQKPNWKPQGPLWSIFGHYTYAILCRLPDSVWGETIQTHKYQESRLSDHLAGWALLEVGFHRYGFSIKFRYIYNKKYK